MAVAPMFVIATVSKTLENFFAEFKWSDIFEEICTKNHIFIDEAIFRGSVTFFDLIDREGETFNIEHIDDGLVTISPQQLTINDLRNEKNPETEFEEDVDDIEVNGSAWKNNH